MRLVQGLLRRWRTGEIRGGAGEPPAMVAAGSRSDPFRPMAMAVVSTMRMRTGFNRTIRNKTAVESYQSSGKFFLDNSGI
ncbi:hypothetical protein ACKI2N_014285 [Cupriavidus sp. 30B13]|uniref:hypothetical protein n=1 Tax=Cupriavidus sp. 30B13 TaxID=3384241 RepID=UPI003B90C219